MTEGSFAPMSNGFTPPPRRWPEGAGKPYVFRFFPDYSAGTPFWSAEWGLLPIRALPLTEELADELERWNEFFETRFHHERGWAPGADGDWFYRQGRSLCERAQAELGADYVIDFQMKNGSSPWG